MNKDVKHWTRGEYGGPPDREWMREWEQVVFTTELTGKRLFFSIFSKLNFLYGFEITLLTFQALISIFFQIQ